MMALYYLSHIAAATLDTPETPINGQPSDVYLPYASENRADAGPRIQQPAVIAPRPAEQSDQYRFGNVGYAYTITESYETAENFCQFHKEVDFRVLRFEPWLKGNCLGPKTWIAKVVSNETKVILKL